VSLVQHDRHRSREAHPHLCELHRGEQAVKATFHRYTPAGQPLKPCRLCGGSTVPEPRAFPDATQRVCWQGSNGMSWCGAGKVGKAHVFVGKPELPLDEKIDGQLQRVTITQTKPGKHASKRKR
jgi:hypothetical protein